MPTKSDSPSLLVSVIGDFNSEILPVYHHFSESCTLHLLLHDDSKRDCENAERIVAGIGSYERKKSPAIRTLHERIDEHSPDLLPSLVERIGRLAGGDFRRVVYNATGTHGTLHFDLSCRLRSLGATILSYDRYENLCETLRDDTRERFDCRPTDILTHLELQGYTVVHTGSPEELARRKSVVLELGLQLERYKEFSDAFARVGSADRIHGYETFKSALGSIGRLEDRAYIQGTLFEEYVYFLLLETGWFDDVLTGVKVRFDADVENEFDILMIRDNHLHTIECKLVKRLDGEHFVYKTDRILRYLDYDGRAMILSIGAPNEREISGGRIRRQFTRGDLARARHAEVLVHQRHRFDPKEFLLDVYDWFIRPYESR